MSGLELGSGFVLIEEGAWTEAMAMAKRYYVGEADKRKRMRQKLFGNKSTGEGLGQG